ncbi:MAG: NAD(P)-dependent oxidoreductase [Sedimentisphaerales bacterium]|nr:NAD(P)-dependent oxidoreductase [Sedimentisphaerales bacterium]
MPKKALITGATGFIGSSLAKKMVKEGWTLDLVTRQNSSLELIEEIVDRGHIHQHDGTTENMCDIVKNAQPDIVFHLASLFLAQHKTSQIEPLIRSNVLFGTQLLEAIAKNQVPFLINVGTYWQHYENKDYDPVCLYAATKQAFGDILKFYTKTSPLKTVSLVLFDTYGPGDIRPKLFSLLKETAKTQKPLEMSRGEQLLDLVYIDDVVDAFLAAGKLLFEGKVDKYEEYAVSSDSPVSLRKVVELFEKVTGQKCPLQWGKKPYRPREIMVPWSKGKKLPGWSCKVNMEDGIKRI